MSVELSYVRHKKYTSISIRSVIFRYACDQGILRLYVFFLSRPLGEWQSMAYFNAFVLYVHCKLDKGAVFTIHQNLHLRSQNSSKSNTLRIALTNECTGSLSFASKTCLVQGMKVKNFQVLVWNERDFFLPPPSLHPPDTVTLNNPHRPDFSQTKAEANSQGQCWSHQTKVMNNLSLQQLPLLAPFVLTHFCCGSNHPISRARGMCAPAALISWTCSVQNLQEHVFSLLNVSALSYILLLHFQSEFSRACFIFLQFTCIAKTFRFFSAKS